MLKRRLLRALRQVRLLIITGWTRGSAAKTKSGEQISFLEKKAARFCLLGATLRVTTDTSMRADIVKALANALPSDVEYKSISIFNDRQKSKYPVVQLIDRAIANVQHS